MRDFLNKPATYDSQTVIQAARREIDRRAWTRSEGTTSPNTCVRRVTS
ncbi:hypothetical protein [Pseudomonas sessilinigenes]|uniref:Uncharacterized protein n=1 Tax=Pseudomonas sessilinigenes TaxID=658629 RepID=A0ABX8MFH1_9PSED|nr:hypothetical protein [Pseudomonas sessilinigenes]AZC24789.1 hypothetical protein C4K39_3115 [Pseudomonas sessilinigenes]QXH37836.1 hypothetical protein KSS89_16205 [Pseudomonas sessilinigenes]